MAFTDLPDGAMVARDGAAWLVKGGTLLPWSFEGYGAPVPRSADGMADVLTPPSIVAVLRAGYRPSTVGKKNRCD
jgi:hypothetical protein